MNGCINYGRPDLQRSLPAVNARWELPLDPFFSLADPPANLREWFSDTTLRFWIEQETQKLHWDRPEVAGYLREHPDLQLKPLLSIWTFALVSLVFGSEDVSRVCRSEPAFEQLTRGGAPFPQELWVVRRRYSTVLERMITGVFIQAIASRFGLSSVLLPVELEEDLRQHASERLEIARHVDACCQW